MAKEPFLPLFFGDFLASTAEWEGEERALYLLLLGYQWSLGSLPVESRRVCKLVGWDWQLFERCWSTVGSKFEANAGRLLNQRLEQHRARSHQISEKRAAAGSVGGRASQAIARAAREQLVGSTEAIARNLLDPPSHPIPSQSIPEKEKNKKPDRRTTRAVTEPAEFSEIRREYPKRGGGQRWGDALKFFKRRLAEGEKSEVILDGVKRYAEFTRATGIERTEKVQQAATFLGDNRGYLELWHPPPKQMSAIERVRTKLNGNGDERVVSEQFGAESQSSLGTVSRVLRRIPDS